MIPPRLRKELRRHAYGNARGPEGPITSEVARLLFPYGAMAQSQMRMESPIVRNAAPQSLRTAVRRLARRGIIGRTGSKYALTDLGRWLVVSRHLGIRFSALCLLAPACCTQDRHARNGGTWFYTREAFEDIFGEYYSQKYINRIFTMLRKKGYASRHYKKSIVVSPQILEDLMGRYRQILESLEAQTSKLKDDEFRIFSLVQEKARLAKELPSQHQCNLSRHGAGLNARSQGPSGSLESHGRLS